MSKKISKAGKSVPKEEHTVNIGKVTSYGGNTTISGRDTKNTFISNSQDIRTTEDFEQLLSQIREILVKSKLDADMINIIDADFNIIETQAKKESPNKNIILNKLKSVAELLMTTTVIVEGSQKLVPMVNQATQWAQQLFK